jgi:hypothetical protein
MKLLKLQLIFLTILAATLALPTFPNIGYLGDGYDLLIANPHNTNPIFSPDPGFRNRVFNLTLYDLGSPTPDGRYQVPMGVSVDLCSACLYGFHSTVSTGTSSYTSSLQQDVSFSFKGWGAAFKASADYSQVEQTTSQQKSVVIETEATCCVYTTSLDLFAPPPFTNNFQTAVQVMPTAFDPTNDLVVVWFGNFIKEFGTHFPLRVSMGGRFGVRNSFNSTAYSNMRSSNLAIDVAAEYDALAVSAAADSLTNISKVQVCI